MPVIPHTKYVALFFWCPLSSNESEVFTYTPYSVVLILCRSEVTCLWSLILSALLPKTGIAATGVILFTVLPVFLVSTYSISTSCFNGTNDVTLASSWYFSDFLVTDCHIKPASRQLLSCSPVNFLHSSSADTPVTDHAPASSTIHQKFLDERLLCRFSILAGSKRKVFWLILLSPPRHGDRELFMPFSPATGKYSPL